MAYTAAIRSSKISASQCVRNIKGTNFSAQATEYTAIRVPAGTRVYVGEVGSQGGPWVGGKSQLLIEGGPQRAWKIGEGKLK